MGVVPTEAASIDVRPGEATNALENEVPSAVLETDNREASEHLFATEVGLGNEPDSFARITEEMNEPDVSGEN